MKVEETDPLDSACPLNTFLLPFKGGVEKEIRAISPLSWPFFPSFPRIRGEKHVSSVASFGQNAVEILPIGHRNGFDKVCDLFIRNF